MAKQKDSFQQIIDGPANSQLPDPKGYNPKHERRDSPDASTVWFVARGFILLGAFAALVLFTVIVVG
jgi:hypothetical protein